jgi:DNA-binding Lrp family transcriptional regulator
VHGLRTAAHVKISHVGPARQVAKAVASLGDIPFVAMVTGGFGVIAEIRSADIAELAEVIAAIRGFDQVQRVETSVYTAVLKDSFLPSRALRPTDLDETDLRLIGLLQADGRTPFADLGEAVSLSAGAARARVLRLLDCGVIHVRGLISPVGIGLTDICGFDLILDGDGTGVLRKIADLDSVDYLAAAVGRSDAVGTLMGRTGGDALASLEQIRCLPGVRQVSAWTHLDRVKERYERPLPASGAMRVGTGPAMGLNAGTWQDHLSAGAAESADSQPAGTGLPVSLWRGCAPGDR